MSKLTSYISALPFGEFLEYLRRQGFIIGVDHHLRLQELLGKIGGQCAPYDLKTLLCPIFATSVKQQEQFYRAFDNFFELFQPIPGEESGKIVETKPAARHEEQKLIVARKWPYFLAGALLIVIIAGIAYWLTNLKPVVEYQQTVGPQISTPQDTTRQVPQSDAIQKPIEKTQTEVALDSARAWTTRIQQPNLQATLRVSKLDIEFSFYQRYGNVIRWTAILAPFIFFLLYEWYRFNRRKLVLQKQRGKKPPHVWPIRVDAPMSKLFNSEQFYAIARFMRQRQIGESYRLDIEKTVAATIESIGYPSFKYKADTKPPEYLVLIDRASFRDQQAQFYDSLTIALEQEGLFVTRFFYDGDPRLCYSETGEGNVYLVELQRKYAGYRLFIFGNGEKIIDPITGRLENWTSVFGGWHDRALLTPEIPQNWGLRETTLASHFIVLPATLEGLITLADYFESPVTPVLCSWRQNGVEPSPPVVDQPAVIEALRTYLGEGTFQWLCACAVYPELHWDLTLYLGSLPCMQEDLISETNLLRLIRLPWFRSGSMPDELRWFLISELEQDKAKVIRSAIINLLEKNPAPKESFAYDTYQLNLVVQRWLLYRRNRNRRREMLQVMQSLPQSKVIKDYTLLRFLESVPISPLNLLLPRGLRKVFYKNGVPPFGLRTSARFLLTLAVMTMAWIGIKPPVLPNVLEQKTSIWQFPEIVPLTGGIFSMGSRPNEQNSLPSQRPRHNVNIAPLAIGKFEVTNAQFVNFLADSGNQQEGGGPWLLVDPYFTKIKHSPSGEFVIEAGFENYPVVGVSWYGAEAYCRWLSQKTGIPFRLPTEAEWEYACRARTESQYSFGDDSSNYDRYGWFLINSSFSPHEVGQKAPNDFGLYDMHGNMWEWCLDAWRPNYQNTPRAGQAVRPTGNELRVVRGGSWYDPVWRARSANRYNFVPILAVNDIIGFRVVASLNDGYSLKPESITSARPSLPNVAYEASACVRTTIFGINFNLMSIVLSTRVNKNNPTSTLSEFKIFNRGRDVLKLLTIVPRPQIAIQYDSIKTISPDDSTLVRFTYRPIQPDTIIGCLKIVLQNLQTSQIDTARLPYRFIALAPQIAVSRKVIDFGDVAIAETKFDSVIIQNIGNVDLDYYMSNMSRVFSILAPETNTIRARQRDILRIFFRPIDGTAYVSSLKIGSNSFTDTTLTINLRGHGFYRFHQGFEFFEKSIVVESDSFIARIVRLDQTRYAFKVLGRDTESNKALSLLQQQEQTQALCILSGGFRLSYTENEPVGLVILDSKQINPVSRGLSGIFAVKNQKVEIDYTNEYKQAENYEYAIQGNPMIVDKGGRIGVQKSKDDRTVFRAFVGLDKRGRIILGTANSASLYDLATYLTRQENMGGLDCDIVLNLEGGIGSAGMLINISGFKREFANTRNPVPNAIAIFDKAQPDSTK